MGCAPTAVRAVGVAAVAAALATPARARPRRPPSCHRARDASSHAAERWAARRRARRLAPASRRPPAPLREDYRACLARPAALRSLRLPTCWPPAATRPGAAAAPAAAEVAQCWSSRPPRDCRCATSCARRRRRRRRRQRRPARALARGRDGAAVVWARQRARPRAYRRCLSQRATKQVLFSEVGRVAGLRCFTLSADAAGKSGERERFFPPCRRIRTSATRPSRAPRMHSPGASASILAASGRQVGVGEPPPPSTRGSSASRCLLTCAKRFGLLSLW